MSKYLVYEMYRVVVVGSEEYTLEKSPIQVLKQYVVNVEVALKLGPEWVLAHGDSYDPCTVPEECSDYPGQMCKLSDGSLAFTGTDSMSLWYFKVVKKGG